MASTGETTASPAPPAPSSSPATSGPAGPAAAAPTASPPPPAADRPRRRRLPLVAAAAVAAALLLVFGGPFLGRAFRTVSTDDAYVNGHATFVAPRVAGQVAEVLVDDNYRVRRGQLLVRLDPEPYDVQVRIKQAAVDSARADLVAADATVRATVAQARSQRFNLQRAIEDVRNQVAVLKSRVAALSRSKASLVLAQQEFDRAKQLLSTKVASREEFDQKDEALRVAQAQADQSLNEVLQTRASLGLPAQPPDNGPLESVPPDLDQTFSAVRQALAQTYQSAAQIGVTFSSFDLTPNQLIAEFYRRDPSGDLGRIYAEIIKDAPQIKQGQTKLAAAQRDLDQANLNRRYCEVASEIDGVVTRRNVNPGNNVQVGQNLMVVRSLREIWVDANFKETQLRNLRVGQPVDLKVDMYGGRQVFRGRVAGFTMGTGSTLSLLPAQNATGNFVKVVQRLPVRIEFLDYDPDRVPLFVGLSVTPEVRFTEPPAGPDAGRMLLSPTTETVAAQAGERAAVRGAAPVAPGAAPTPPPDRPRPPEEGRQP